MGDDTNQVKVAGIRRESCSFNIKQQGVCRKLKTGIAGKIQFCSDEFHSVSSCFIMLGYNAR